MNTVHTKTIRCRIIDPRQNVTPFSLPGSPQELTKEKIEKINSRCILKELEYQYDKYLEEMCQLLMLYDMIDEVIDLRNHISSRLRKLAMEKIKLETREKYRLLVDEVNILCKSN
jgi:hypothetical protein